MVLSENCGSSNFLIVEKSNEPMIQQFSNAWEKIIFKLWPSWASYLAPSTKPRGIMAGVRERVCESVSVCERERERERKREGERERDKVSSFFLIHTFTFLIKTLGYCSEWCRSLITRGVGGGKNKNEK